MGTDAARDVRLRHHLPAAAETVDAVLLATDHQPGGLAAQNAAVTQAATNSAGNTPTALSPLSSFTSQAVEAPTGVQLP